MNLKGLKGRWELLYIELWKVNCIVDSRIKFQYYGCGSVLNIISYKLYIYIYIEYRITEWLRQPLPQVRILHILESPSPLLQKYFYQIQLDQYKIGLTLNL